MFYCVNCGREIPESYAFCPNCGAKRYEEPVQASVAAQPVVQEQPATPKTTGRVRGLGIASMAVGIEGLIVAVLASIYGFFGLMFAAMADMLHGGAAFGIFSLILGLVGLASGIVASILSRKALAENPDFRFAVLGKGFGLAAAIASGAAILIGLLAIAL